MKKIIFLYWFLSLIATNGVQGQYINQSFDFDSIKKKKDEIYEKIKENKKKFSEFNKAEERMTISGDTITIKSESTGYIQWKTVYVIKDDLLLQIKKTKLNDESLISLIITFGIVLIFFMLNRLNKNKKNNDSYYWIILYSCIIFFISFIAYFFKIPAMRDYYIFFFVLLFFGSLIIAMIKNWRIPQIFTITIFGLHLSKYRESVVRYDGNLSFVEPENMIYIINVAIFIMALVIYYYATKQKAPE